MAETTTPKPSVPAAAQAPAEKAAATSAAPIIEKGKEAASSPAAAQPAPDAAKEAKSDQTPKADKTPQETSTKAGEKTGEKVQAPAKAADAAQATILGEAPTAPVADPAKPSVPEKYDLKLPDGSLLDANYPKTLETYAKANGLTQEQAQVILNREHAARADLAKQTDAWKQEAANDSEIGGDKFAENCEIAKRFVDRFAPPSLKQKLDQTGLGNNPDLLKMMVRAARAGAEDRLVQAPQQTRSKEVSAAQALYPNLKSKSA